MSTNNVTQGYVNGLVSNGTTFTLAGDMGGRPSEPSRGLLSTNAVRTMAGWVGQVIIARSIVFEAEPCETSEEAVNLANERVIGVFTELFMKQVGDATSARTTGAAGSAGE